MTAYSDDEGVPLKRGYVFAENLNTGDVSAYKIRDGKILSSFTRVVEETGVLDQGRSQKETSRDE